MGGEQNAAPEQTPLTHAGIDTEHRQEYLEASCVMVRFAELARQPLDPNRCWRRMRMMKTFCACAAYEPSFELSSSSSSSFCPKAPLQQLQASWG